jgi:hypothetical protein
MMAGEPDSWDDLFRGQLVPAILALVLEAWDRIEKPTDDEHEDKISVRLYVALRTGKDRNRHPFQIHYQAVEVDIDLNKVTGRKDIVFFPSLYDEDIYFCLEAKRLNARIGDVMKSLADEYVKEGMQRFIDGKYSKQIRHGGMLGYVLDGDIDRAMKNVWNNILSNHKFLGMDSPGDWIDSRLHPNTKETQHRRNVGVSPFCIYHLFVSGMRES